MSLTAKERALAVRMLRLAADQFSNHGCNDYDISVLFPSIEERQDLERKLAEWNGDLEEAEAEGWITGEYIQMDWMLMRYLADKLEVSG